MLPRRPRHSLSTKKERLNEWSFQKAFPRSWNTLSPIRSQPLLYFKFTTHKYQMKKKREKKNTLTHTHIYIWVRPKIPPNEVSTHNPKKKLRFPPLYLYFAATGLSESTPVSRQVPNMDTTMILHLGPNNASLASMLSFIGGARAQYRR